MDIIGSWFVVGPMGASHDPAPLSNAQRQPRSNMFLAAVLRTGGDQVPVKIRNMSPKGAMVEGPLTLHPGAKAELIRGALRVQGTVMWNSQIRCGLQFSSEVSVKDWLAAPTKVQQQRVDDMVALVKGAGITEFIDLPTLLNRTDERRSDEKLISDLGAVVELMQDLEDDLASSNETLARHGLKLQNLDIAMQMVRAIADMLMSGSSDRAVHAARLDDLRVACAQALGTP